MGLNDFQVFNSWMQSSATEVIAQDVDKWNEATNGALVLRASDMNVGDYDEESLYSQIANLYGNRDAYGTGALAAVDLAQLLNTSVKVASHSLPVRYTGSSFDWTRRDPAEAGVVFGTQVGRAKMQYMLNSAIAAVSAAIGTQSALLYDGTAGNASLQSLNQGAAKFGDRAGSIVAWVMHSKSLHDIYGQSLDNSNRLFQIGNVQVMDDGFGRPLIMTDSPALFFDNAGTDNYHQIGLVAGGAVVEDNGDSRTYTETKTEQENAIELIKEESSFNLGLKGYTWDKANGGKSPDDAAISLGTNWDKSATELKDTAGVRVTTL